MYFKRTKNIKQLQKQQQKKTKNKNKQDKTKHVLTCTEVVFKIS